MDELKIVSDFLKSIVQNVLVRIIRKKIGNYNTDILLNEFNAKINNDKLQIHINADIMADKSIILALINMNKEVF